LRDVPLERLSSGALLRIDRDGDLVETAAEWSQRIASRTLASSKQNATAAVALDRRVGRNIRLGDDPAALPADRRAQAEPHIARAPADPDVLLATFQEGRFGNGGAANCGYSTSRDGGLTWSRALIPNTGAPSGGPYERVTDPVAGINGAGVAFLNTLGLITRQTSTGQSDFDGSVLVSRSFDGGATFEPPILAYKEPNADTFADKNWMAINTFPGTPAAGRIVLTFTIFSNIGGANHAIARVFSDDQGVTWSSPAYVHSSNRQVQGSQPVFLADGRFVIVYWNFNGTTSSTDDFLEVVESFDGGNTFAAPRFVTSVAIYDQPTIRDGGFLPSATTDRTTSTVYVTYPAVHNGAPRIMFTKSGNPSAGWTAPIAVSDNPANTGVFNPAIAASPDGQTLTVAFYSTRDNPGSTTLVDMYLAQSFDGGATWQPNIRITSESTDATLAVNTGSASNPQYMLGDYLGIAEPTNANVPAVPVWVDTRTGNPDPFIARIGVSPSLNFASWRAARFSLGQINDPSIGGEAADADGDGENNRSEFLSNTDPIDPVSVFRIGARLLNISTRARVGSTDESALIAGFVIDGAAPKRILARAIGPTLANFGVAGSLQDPTLQLVPRGSDTSITNDNWMESDPAAINETGHAPDDPREAAIVQTLPPGAYTAIVRGKNNSAGVALAEVYDVATGAAVKVTNLSSRGFVGVGDNVMIGGIVIGPAEGTNGARVVLRGVGPTLAAMNVPNVLQDPELLLFNINGALIGYNDDWQQTQAGELSAVGLAPGDPREAAIIAALPSGHYTAIVRGKNQTSGVALVEAFDAP
jgi:hypothetical protein